MQQSKAAAELKQIEAEGTISLRTLVANHKATEDKANQVFKL